MNEILTGIRIIKFYAWEKPFGKEVDRLRGKELKALTQYAYFVACIFSLILSSVPFIQPILVFTTYTAIQDEPLDAGTAFATIALFNLMRIPFAFLPMVFLQVCMDDWAAAGNMSRWILRPSNNISLVSLCLRDSMNIICSAVDPIENCAAPCWPLPRTTRAGNLC